MAEFEPQGDGGELLDAAGLRARLGLPPKASRFAAGSPFFSGDLAEDDDEKTPLPTALSDTLQEGDVDLGAPGGSRLIPLKPTIVAILLVAMVGLFLGRVLGDSLAQLEQKTAHQMIVAKKLTLLRDSTTQSGSTVVAALADLHSALAQATRDIDALEGTSDPLKLEKVFEELLPKLITFKREGVFIDPDKMMDGITVIYADDLLLEASRFSVRTRHLFDTIAATIDEATALAKIARPAGAATQTIYAEITTRELKGGKKIPSAVAHWVKDTGKPDLVKLTNERTGKKSQEWQMMVLVEGKKDPEQVPTDRIASLEMKPIYDKHALAVRLHTVARLSTLIRKAKTLSGRLGWKAIERRMTDWNAETN